MIVLRFICLVFFKVLKSNYFLLCFREWPSNVSGYHWRWYILMWYCLCLSLGSRIVGDWIKLEIHWTFLWAAKPGQKMRTSHHWDCFKWFWWTELWRPKPVTTAKMCFVCFFPMLPTLIASFKFFYISDTRLPSALLLFMDNTGMDAILDSSQSKDFVHIHQGWLLLFIRSSVTCFFVLNLHIT